MEGKFSDGAKTTAWVGHNLPENVTDMELKEHFGYVEDKDNPIVDLKLTAKGTRVAYVTFTTSTACDMAVQQLDGTMLKGGWIIRVNRSGDSSPPLNNATVTLGKLPSSLTDDRLREVCSNFGPVVSFGRAPLGPSARVEFSTPEAAEKALQGLSVMTLEGAQITVKSVIPPQRQSSNSCEGQKPSQMHAKSKPPMVQPSGDPTDNSFCEDSSKSQSKTTAWVGYNLPENVTDMELKEHFGYVEDKDNPIVDLKLTAKGTRVAYVTFTTSTACDMAVQQLDGTMLKGGWIIRVNRSGDSSPPLNNATVTLGRLPSSLTDDRLREVCSNFGPVVSFGRAPLGPSARVEFSTPEAAEKALQGLSVMTLEGAQIKAKRMSLFNQAPSPFGEHQPPSHLGQHPGPRFPGSHVHQASLQGDSGHISKSYEPGVADGDVPGAAFVARFAILTANDNEWESAKYFMGTPMDKCKITSDLKRYLTEKSNFSQSFEADKISRTFVRDFKTYSLVKVCGVPGVLTKCSEMGSHVAGGSRDTVTSLLQTAHTQKWKLEAVFIVGCCGCSSLDNIDLGAVLIANPILQYAGKLTDNGSEMSDVKNTYSIVDQSWVRALKVPNGLHEVDEELKVKYLLSPPILSGDFLMKCGELAKNYRETKLGRDASLLGFEMEGAGAYAACDQNILPLDQKTPVVLVVKGVSDSANSDKNKKTPTAFFKETLPDVDKDCRQQMCTIMSLMIVFRAIKSKLAIDYADRPGQKLLGGGEVRQPEPFGTAHLTPIRHPLESKFIQLFETVQRRLERTKAPALDELKQFCKLLFCRDTSTEAVDICRATSYQEVVGILYRRSYWMGYNYIDMLICRYGDEPLNGIKELLDSYNTELASILTSRLAGIKEKIPEALLRHQFQPERVNLLQKIFVRFNLDADGITLESLVHNVQFLSSRLQIQPELLDVLRGSVALVLRLPTERAVQVWSRIEECFRELWKMRVVWIHLEGEHNRSMNLMQKTNAEKIKYIPHILSWKEELLDAVGSTLYNEYGSQPALKSAVEEYKSAGDPLAEQKASLDWLFHHHVPTESRSLLVDPFAVLGRTLFLADCDGEKVIEVLVKDHCLRDPDLSVLQRWQLLGKKKMGVDQILPIPRQPHLLIPVGLLSPEWIQLLRDKYLHLLPPNLMESSRQDDKDLSAVLDWLDWHFANRSIHFLRALISCDVEAEQLKKWILHSRVLAFQELPSLSEYLESAFYRSDEKKSLEIVNEILDSNIIFRPSSNENVLERQQEDIFVTYFQLIANQGGSERWAEHVMHGLRASVPSEYQRDLEEAFQSVVMKRGEGIALSTGHQSVPGTSTQGQQSAYSSGLETSTAEYLTKVKREYQFQVSHMIPWLSSVRADNADKLKQVLLALTVHSDDPGLLLFKETDVKDVSGPILQYSAWYESDVLQQLLMECLARKADELKIFEQDRRSLLGHISVDKAFPSPLLSFPPLLGYSPMVVHLALSPTWVTMWQVWELKNIICSALHLQPYSLLLRGYSAGSTNLVFYLASSARVTTERVGVAMMSSDVIIHSMVFGCGTQHEVKYHLDQFLSESAPQPSPHVQPSC